MRIFLMQLEDFTVGLIELFDGKGGWDEAQTDGKAGWDRNDGKAGW